MFLRVIAVPYRIIVGLRTVLNGNITVLSRINDERRLITRLNLSNSPKHDGKGRIIDVGQINPVLIRNVGFRPER